MKNIVVQAGRLQVRLPTTPNFIFEMTGGRERGPYPLDYYTEDELREIGKAWTERLVERRAEQAKAGVR